MEDLAPFTGSAFWELPAVSLRECNGAVGMTTSVIPQKGLPKDYLVNKKGDSLVSQKWGETPVIPQPWSVTL